MRDLFEPISKEERQAECVEKWIQHKCRGTIEAATGFGKTFVAIKAIKRVLRKYPNFKILVIVPTELLQTQWRQRLEDNGITNCGVHVINTAINYNWDCDILILDECHRFAADTFSKVFSKIKYRLILGLTATLKRLDEKHVIIEKFCPVVDTIPLEVAIQNGWVSDFTEYKVYLDVDLTQYKEYNREFTSHFEFFNYDFKLASSMVGEHGFRNRVAYRDMLYNGSDSERKREIFNSITYHAVGLMRTMQQRKDFINSHPDKIRIVRTIIGYRPNSKIMTFSATTKIAESIGIGYVYSGKKSVKKKGRLTIEEFSKLSSGVLNTVKKADEGLDIADLSVAIMLGIDSSPTKKDQRIGRVIRKEEGKCAEIFTLVIRGTVEEEWFNKSHPDNLNIVPIDEENLMHVLKGEPYETYKKKPMKMSFRF